jgi:hypothetical protein
MQMEREAKEAEEHERKRKEAVWLKLNCSILSCLFGSGL